MKRFAILLTLLCLLVSGCAARSEEYKIAQGTEWENTVRVLRGKADGPAVYLIGGVHGDETAGWTAANRVKDWELKAGTVYVLSPANVYGAEHDQRETRSKRDLNRNFPGNPDGWDAERIAASIYADVADKRPALVLDLHETRGATQPERDDLSNSIILWDVAPVSDLVWGLLEDSAAGTLGDVPLTLLGSPPEGSVNRTVSENLGIPVITVETWRGEELETRVKRQLGIVDYVLRHYGLR